MSIRPWHELIHASRTFYGYYVILSTLVCLTLYVRFFRCRQDTSSLSVCVCVWGGGLVLTQLSTTLAVICKYLAPYRTDGMSPKAVNHGKPARHLSIMTNQYVMTQRTIVYSFLFAILDFCQTVCILLQLFHGLLNNYLIYFTFSPFNSPACACQGPREDAAWRYLQSFI